MSLSKFRVIPFISARREIFKDFTEDRISRIEFLISLFVNGSNDNNECDKKKK